jgi:hypothetical protein
MTFSPCDETAPVPVLMPVAAIELDPPLPAHASDREMAIAALRQGLADRSVDLPLGPEIDPADPSRLLAINHRAVQLVCAPVGAERVLIPLRFWQSAPTAPQLLLLAVVDDENSWVDLVGTLTATEFLARASHAVACDEGLLLPIGAFRGGLARLLRLVRLLRSDALPRLALPGATAGAAASGTAVAVWDWLNGRLQDSLAALGGVLLQPAPVAVRSASALLPAGSPAGLVVSLALRGDRLAWGDQDPSAPERLQLLIALAGGQPDGKGVIVRLECQQPGLPLPDDLRLCGRQGEKECSLVSRDVVTMELPFAASAAPLVVSVAFQDGEPLELPPLALLAADAP